MLILALLACTHAPEDLPLTWVLNLPNASEGTVWRAAPLASTASALEGAEGAGAAELWDQQKQKVYAPFSVEAPPPEAPRLTITSTGIEVDPGYEVLPPHEKTALPCRLQPCAPRWGRGEINDWVEAALLEKAIAKLQFPPNREKVIAIAAAGEAPWAMTALTAARAGTRARVAVEVNAPAPSPGVDLPCDPASALARRQVLPTDQRGVRWLEVLDPSASGERALSSMADWQPFPGGGFGGLLTCISPGRTLITPGPLDRQVLVWEHAEGLWSFEVGGPTTWWGEASLSLSDPDSNGVFEVMLRGQRGGVGQTWVLRAGGPVPVVIPDGATLKIEGERWIVRGDDERTWILGELGFRQEP